MFKAAGAAESYLMKELKPFRDVIGCSSLVLVEVPASGVCFVLCLLFGCLPGNGGVSVHRLAVGV